MTALQELAEKLRRISGGAKLVVITPEEARGLLAIVAPKCHACGAEGHSAISLDANCICGHDWDASAALP